MEEDIRKQFYGQNSMDFYIKDIGTILPGMLFCASSLGIDPVEAIKYLDYDIWGIDKVANSLRKYMNQESEKREAA
jgi:hypothetical protein